MCHSDAPCSNSHGKMAFVLILEALIWSDYLLAGMFNSSQAIMDSFVTIRLVIIWTLGCGKNIEIFFQWVN